ncbi:hypothetical protein [Chryseobacterium turcicum]|uniref:Chalcone isomerase domain-containing protein n=1 Tax=Chryseobacterium turcicum TaxID=2898076 RepID=A0A9Q3YXM8_9FLAO|nr:hypothetical protein [Chryseobacterium turcicum]MCD1117267.1 hypothetical protein [Chryseobacterium turcicum]
MKNVFMLALIFCASFCFAQKEDLKKTIKEESIGGSLDFTKTIEEKYSSAPFIRFGDILYNKKDFAILFWGAKVKHLGIESLDEAIKLWEEIHKKKLTKSENKALKTGFETKFE